MVLKALGPDWVKCDYNRKWDWYPLESGGVPEDSLAVRFFSEHNGKKEVIKRIKENISEELNKLI